MKRGAIVLVAGSGPYSRKPRPAVVVQAEEFGGTESIVVCPLTTHDVDAPLFRPSFAPGEASGLQQVSYAMVDKIYAIPRRNIGGVIGQLRGDQIAALDGALATFLGLAAAS
ncbi:type II toxin-antitoxin system PemK/MazF family toxin [Caenispirillum bisanense]|uniref:mRNA interferase MazF n=1 Tax=Caenispirillum bisanense TaxID=414052 RepID=A0A286GWX1_9PROT|nr:type II toxin-antitoxin system PemK/MazF family toxin [Caenispirillum bisanense]SOD99982.1 mRNA interferase MazF [Caenispirillum bisanense]